MIPTAVAIAFTLTCTTPEASMDAPATPPCPVATPIQQTIAGVSLQTTPPPFAVPSSTGPSSQGPFSQGPFSQGPSSPAPTSPAPAAPPQPAPVTQGDASSPVAIDPDEIVVTAKRRGSREADPVAAVNEVSFAATQAVDTAVVRPVAMGYAKVVPKPVRNGLRNFLYNLFEPVVFLNYLLQLKPGKAFETVGRFAVNTTLGVVGLFDFAKRKPFGLPRRENGFADTLGYYGVKPGAFLFLPIVGPTTVRDLFGNTIDGLLLPVAVGSPFNKRIYTVSTGLGGALDDRVENDTKLAAQRKASVDAYSANRDAYLAMREAEIAHLRERTKKPARDPIKRSPSRTRLPIP